MTCSIVSSCMLLAGSSCDGGAGVEQHCTEYQYVEQRQGWEAEQRRLKKELEKHSKQATKVWACFKLSSSCWAVACCLKCPLRLCLLFRGTTNSSYHTKLAARAAVYLYRA